jgi:hypothetical protein
VQIRSQLLVCLCLKQQHNKDRTYDKSSVIKVYVTKLILSIFQGNVPFQRGGMATRGNGGPVSNENGQRMPFTAPSK